MIFYLFSSVWGGGYLLGFAISCLLWWISVMKLPAVAESEAFMPLVNMMGYFLFYVVLAQWLHKVMKNMDQKVAMTVVVLVLNLLPFLVWLGICLFNFNLSAHEGQELRVWWNNLMCLSMFRYFPDIVETCDWNEYFNLIGVFLGALGFLAAIPLVVKQFLGFRKPTAEEWNQLMTPQDKK